MRMAARGTSIWFIVNLHLSYFQFFCKLMKFGSEVEHVLNKSAERERERERETCAHARTHAHFILIEIGYIFQEVWNFICHTEDKVCRYFKTSSWREY
jgi:hypothetical protein